jgi:hypothetical protein
MEVGVTNSSQNFLLYFLRFCVGGPADTSWYCRCRKPKLFFKLRRVTGAMHWAPTNVSSVANEWVENQGGCMEPSEGVTPTAALSRLHPNEFAQCASFISGSTLDRAPLLVLVLVSSGIETSSLQGTQMKRNLVRFQVLTAASMRMSVFWDVAPRSLVETNRRFRALVISVGLQHPRRQSSSRRNLPPLLPDDGNSQFPKRRVWKKIEDWQYPQ